MSFNNTIVMEACENGLWRLCKNSTGCPPSSAKWIHVEGPYYRRAPGIETPQDWLRPTVIERAAPPTPPSAEQPQWNFEKNPVLAALKRL
jgi:hypothetical protein